MREYTKRVQATAGTSFGRRFLNTDVVAKEAWELATRQMQNSAIKWVAGVAILFKILQLAVSWVSPAAVNGWHTTEVLRQEVSELKEQIRMLSMASNSTHPNDSIGETAAEDGTERAINSDEPRTD